MSRSRRKIKSVTLNKIEQPTNGCNYEVTITYQDGHTKKRKMTNEHIKTYYSPFLISKEQKDLNQNNPSFSRSGHFLFTNHKKNFSPSEEECCRLSCTIL